MKLRLWGLLALIVLPFMALAALGVRTAVQGRGAFAELNRSLEAATEAVRLEGLVRQGVASQLATARRYLAQPDEQAWRQFTRLTWTVYENEVRYLALPLTPEERLAVERMRSQHRLFEGVLQEAMARAGEPASPSLPAQLDDTYQATTGALEDVSRMLQERLGATARRADATGSGLGSVVATLAALFAASLLLCAGLVLRAAGMQRRLLEVERLAAVAQVRVALRHEINNPLSVVVGAADLLRERPDDPDAVREWAEAVASAAARIRDVLKRLEELGNVETVEYLPGLAMLDLKTGPLDVAPEPAAAPVAAGATEETAPRDGDTRGS